LVSEPDKSAASRKEDHIDLAFKSATQCSEKDNRFYYEPIHSGHLNKNLDLKSTIANKTLNYPIWVSSMTGGTEKAALINTNLAKVCGLYGLGMGLGSCRQLLYENKRIHEFDMRPLMPHAPFFINLGIAQVEQLILKNELAKITDLINSLSADGLIVHINPLQEFLQPEGDIIEFAPIDTIITLLDKLTCPIMVKEVGQGFGPKSLNSLLELPLEAIELAGYGGTNFSKLELLRSEPIKMAAFEKVLAQGHSCTEMLTWINDFYDTEPELIKCKKIIFSGGIKDFLDGYYFTKKSKLPSIYAQASGLLKYALDFESLCKYVELQIEGLTMAHSFLKLKA